MSTSIEAYSYDFKKLIELIKAHCQIEDNELIEKVLLSGGEKIGERYLILNNEYWEDFNSYYNVPIVLDELFEVDDTFGNCFCCYPSVGDKKEIMSSVSKEEIYQEIKGHEEDKDGKI